MLRDRRIKCINELLQTFRPISGLQYAQELDYILSGRISDHHRWIGECLKNGCFDEGEYFRGGAKDEAGIVLEQITSNCTYAIFLLRHRGEDVRQVRNIVRDSCKAIKFL
jgi:hypothetical protein